MNFRILMLCCLAAGLVAADAIPASSSPELERLPVLHQGRIKPLAVAADEIVLAIAGKSLFGLVEDDGLDKPSPEHLRIVRTAPPLDMLVDLTLHADAWRTRPLVHVPNLELRKQLHLRGQWATLEQLSTPEAAGLLRGAAMKQMRGEQTGEAVATTELEAEAAAAGRRMLLAQDVLAGHAFQLTPLATNDAERGWILGPAAAALRAEQGVSRPWHDRARAFLADRERLKGGDPWRTANADLWLDLDDLALHPDPLLADWPGHELRDRGAAWKAAMDAGGDRAATASALTAALRARGEADVALRRRDHESYFAAHPEARGDPTMQVAEYPTDARIGLELANERAQPFARAMAAYLIGGLLTALGLGRAARRGRPSWWTRIGVALTVVGIALTAGGIAVRSVIAGFGPVTNLFGTFTWVALVSSALGLVLARMTGKGVYAVAAGIAAGLCVLVGHVIPPDYRQIEQLQPVLRSQYWLVVHVMTEVASYGAFLVAWLIGNIVLWDAWRRRAKVAAGDAQAIYRAIQVGVVLVAAGTLLGAVWADKAWGRFWGWDPKEVWALVTFLTYLVPLHLRYAGVVGPTGLAAWSVLGFLSVVMSWWGVNFFIGAGLHAYATGHGFGTFTTDQIWVFVLSGAQAALTVVQVVSIRHETRDSRRESRPTAAVAANDP